MRLPPPQWYGEASSLHGKSKASPFFFFREFDEKNAGSRNREKTACPAPRRGVLAVRRELPGVRPAEDSMPQAAQKVMSFEGICAAEQNQTNDFAATAAIEGTNFQACRCWSAAERPPRQPTRMPGGTRHGSGKQEEQARQPRRWIASGQSPVAKFQRQNKRERTSAVTRQEAPS